MKKKNLLAFSAMLLGTAAFAQTEVTVGVMQGKDYGVTYMLPKTEIAIVLHATKHQYTPGEYCKYAGRYLRMNGISPDAAEYWTLDKLEVRSVGVPDMENVYFVKLKDKSTAPLMELTEDGIVRSINMPFSGKKKDAQAEKSRPAKREVDPRQFLTEEILLSNSTAKMAELVAKEIYDIRESKNALLRGEADNTPQDGEQLKLMLDNLNVQEEALTAMFTGRAVKTEQTFTVRIVPEEMTDEVAFRFSRKLGVVDNDDLAGEPYYISISDLRAPTLSEEAQKGGKKKEEGVVYNVPGQAKVTLTTGDNRMLFEGELPVTQFGSKEYLAPVLFNKNSTIKVLFDTTTGGLLKIERE